MAAYPFVWQLTQATPICAPVSGKVVAVLWLNVEGLHAVTLWQVWQSVENLAVIWFGLVVALKFAWWQLTQVVGIVAYPFLWQLTQATPICAPVNGKVVAVLWLNVEGLHAVTLWQVWQSVENFAVIWFGLVDAL